MIVISRWHAKQYFSACMFACQQGTKRTRGMINKNSRNNEVPMYLGKLNQRSNRTTVVLSCSNVSMDVSRKNWWTDLWRQGNVLLSTENIKGHSFLHEFTKTRMKRFEDVLLQKALYFGYFYTLLPCNLKISCKWTNIGSLFVINIIHSKLKIRT